jgi:hypothetical protein
VDRAFGVLQSRWALFVTQLSNGVFSRCGRS